LQAQRKEIFLEKEKLLLSISNNDKIRNQKSRLKDELEGRLAYEIKLEDTLNRII